MPPHQFGEFGDEFARFTKVEQQRRALFRGGQSQLRETVALSFDERAGHAGVGVAAPGGECSVEHGQAFTSLSARGQPAGRGDDVALEPAHVARVEIEPQTVGGAKVRPRRAWFGATSALARRKALRSPEM